MLQANDKIIKAKQAWPRQPGGAEEPGPTPRPRGREASVTAKGCRQSSVPRGQSQVSVGEVKRTLRGEAEGKGLADE